MKHSGDDYEKQRNKMLLNKIDRMNEKVNISEYTNYRIESIKYHKNQVHYQMDFLLYV